MHDDYLKAWTTINAMIRSGRSFSGHERHCCFLNLSGQNFADIAAVAGLDLADDGRGVGVVDWDADGDLDLWITNRTGPRARFLRNQLDTSRHHYLALKLIGDGSSCNRDAIGSRVELHLAGAAPRKLIRSVTAGNGFLSQSSRWLHFGLGDVADVKRLVIRWADGRRDEIARPKADQFYTLRHGQTALQPWQRVENVSDRDPTATTPDQPSMTQRIVLQEPLPLPELAYSNLDGHTRSLQGEPVLLNLWATWCAPCLQELDALGQRAAELDQAKLPILAINVGDPDGDTDVDAVRKLRPQLHSALELGLASRELIEKLDVVQRTVVSIQQPLPLPTSFLIDQNQRLHVIYKGPVDIDQLLRDRAAMDGAGGAIDAHLPGRWVARPPGLTPMAVAMKFVEAGAYDDAQEYLKRSVSIGGQSDAKLAEMYHVLGTILVDQGQVEQAEDAYRQAIRVAGDHWRSRFDLGILYFQQEQFAAAHEQFDAALKLKPNDADMLNKLGLVAVRLDRWEEAVQSFQRALKIDANHLASLLNSAETYQQMGQHSQAVKLLSRAARIEPGDARLHFQLASSLMQTQRTKDALGHFQQALKLRPQWHQVANNVAWILASHPDASVRDARQAVAIAQRICAASQDQNVSYLDTLSVAYAAAGRFEEAQRRAGQAIELAQSRGQGELAKRLEARLQRFRANQAYVDQSLK